MRLIDADALKDKLQNLAYDDWNQGANTTWANAYGEVAEMVDEEPTADIPDRKVGEWKHGYCSECEYNWGKDAPIASVPNFCPNCGARMKTADNERDYKRAIEQMQHDMLYEKTYNSEDGSM